MSLTDFQFNYNGLTMGDQTSYDVVAVRGLDDLPQMRTSDVLRPLDDGAFPGSDFLPTRVFEMDVVIEGATDALFRANVDALGLATAKQVSELPFTYQTPGAGNRLINCKPRRRLLPVDMLHKYRIPQATIQFEATDPRIYDANQQSASLTVPTVSGGLAFPLAFPLSFGSATGGAVVVNNAGTYGSRPVVVFNGPLTNPKIERVTPTDLFMLFNITLLNGDVLNVDFQAKTVLLGGTATRYFTMDATSTWWEVAPGSNQIQLSATSGTGNAVVTFRSAWV